MTDDIVTRLRDLAMKEESPWANIYDNVMRESADEIERLRAELYKQSLKANIMRNVAMVPYGDSAGVIEELMADRDRWAEFAIHIATCPNWGKRTCWDCVSPTNQDQARQAGLEETIRSEYGKR
jgi:hypothetical protein